MSFRVEIDPTNPGQFFACCGLFELSSRLDGNTLAHFEPGVFVVDTTCSLSSVLSHCVAADLRQLDLNDETASPLLLGPPFDLQLDWWKDEMSGGQELKVWAGSMRSVRIAQAMIGALRDPLLQTENLFNLGRIVYDLAEPTKKVEPFYFDARRASNAHSRDVGFAPNDLELTTTAYPAVEALCLIGLQRCRPQRPRLVGRAAPRVYRYRTWPRALPVSIVGAVTACVVSMPGMLTYQFEAWYRTGQKKHKAFRSAVVVAEGE